MNLLRSTGVVLALAASLAAVGCGGGGSSSSKSASTAAGVTSQNHAPLPEARAGHTAVRLQSGEILIVGGFDTLGNPMASTVIVSSAGVTRGPSLSTARAGHSAVLLSTGEVLIAGGQSDDLGVDVLDSSEIYDPQTQTITPGPTLAEARAHHVALSYFDGANEHVLFAGGVAALDTQTNVAPALASAESYDATQNVVSAAGSLSAAQSHAKIARLDTGGLLIVGGKDATGPAEAQLFDPQTRSFSAVSSVAARSGAAVASRGREVLVAGGESGTGLEDTSEVFDSLSGTFSAGALLGSARFEATATVVGNEIVLVGGRDAQSAVNSVERLQGTSIGTSAASKHLDLATARYAHTATFYAADQLLIVGGYDRTGTPTSAIEIVDLNASIAAATSGSSSTPSSTGSSTGTGGSGTGLSAPSSGGVAGMGGASTPPATTPIGTTPSTTPTTTPSTGSTTPSTGSGSGGSGSFTSTLLQSAIQALTASSGSGGGFSGFLSTFAQTLLQNLLGGGSTGGGSGLSGILSSLLGGGSGSGATAGSGSGLSGLLSSLLGGGSGSGATAGSGGGLSGLLSSLLGGGSGSGATAGSGTSGGGLSGLLSSLFGGGSGSSSSTGTSSTGSGATSSPSSTALTIQSMSPGQGAVGSQVTITGVNFGSNVSVTFNGVPAGINSATINGQNVVTVVCTLPSGATTGMVEVSSGGQTANAGVFTVQ